MEDEIKTFILTTLPMLGDAAASDLAEKIVQIGVDCMDDLKLLSESDLTPSLLNPIQARKLLAAAKGGQ